jgi:hypothetical protein
LSSVVFAPTLAAARKAGRNLRDSRFASPKSDGALDEAFKRRSPVRFFAPTKNAAFWELVRRRYWLPAIPGLLRDAIGGIARHNSPDPSVSEKREGPSRGSSQALWIEGKLSDARARSLLANSGEVLLWVVEDFRKLGLSDPVLRRIEKAGIRICALRPLRASVLRSRR